MKPEKKALDHLGMTRSKAKMYEFGVPIKDHINPSKPLSNLLDLTIGILGELSSEAEFNSENLNDLLFSAKYFDALLNSRSDADNSNYLKLLGASAYYLADQPGSCKVLINTIHNIDEDANQLDLVLLNILKSELLNHEEINKYNPYIEYIYNIYTWLNHFYQTGDESDLIIDWIEKLKLRTRKFGSDRELLFGDIIYSVRLKSLSNSSWTALPKFSNLDKDLWRPYLIKNNSIKFLWPSQLLLGEKDVFKGNSAIIQMPTSAGKTKSAELIVRSSFLSKRSTTAVIIAPFKALCQEIYNSLFEQFSFDNEIELNLVSDVLQIDLDVDKTIKQILILTPEKFEYILRFNDELVNQVGLIIYDEGHLLDDYHRGTKYELLLASVKRRLKPEAQVVLISAVLPNSGEVAEWLIGERSKSIQARNLATTSQSLAFVSWTKSKGILQFVDKLNPDLEEFYVPKILEQQKLNNKPKERKERYYPEYTDYGYKSADIASLLGCKLSRSGTVAIFVSTKILANSIAKSILDAFSRGLEWEVPFENCDEGEMDRILSYTQRLTGTNSIFYNLARLGILLHHASVPHGLRLSVEYALQKQHCKVVICTSTLAQGVNLPIRYLIVTSEKPSS